MALFDIWASIFLILLVAASSAYPFNTRSKTFDQESTPVFLRVNAKYVGGGYPVYPTLCLPTPKHGRPHAKLSDLPDILSDCSWIINKDLLQQHSLLFQNLVFGYTHFTDQSGKRYRSRWGHGHCVINVITGVRYQTETLQLFNIVLAANKVLKECIEDQRFPLGGTIHIGSPDKNFFVNVLGSHDNVDVNESDNSLLANLNVSGRHIQRDLLRTKLITGLSSGDLETDESIVSPPEIRVQKRSSTFHHRSPLLKPTQRLNPGGAWSTSNLIVPLANLSTGVQAPPNYPVDCFNPYLPKLRHASEEDCNLVINEIILRYPDPMSPKTFGYDASADIDLSLPENEKWIYGRCVVFVRNIDRTRTDTFRMVDVASAAHNIVGKCITGVKYPLGGTTAVGSVAGNFYVGVGGSIGE